MRVHSIAIAIVGGIFAGIYEATVSGFAPSYIQGIHPIVPGIALFVLYEHVEAAIIFAIIAGGIGDVFAVDASRFTLASYTNIALVLIFLARSIFTNRSLYTAIALCLVGRFGESLWMMGVNLLQQVSVFAGISWMATDRWWHVFLADAFVMSAAYFSNFMIRRTVRGHNETRKAIRAHWYG